MARRGGRRGSRGRSSSRRSRGKSGGQGSGGSGKGKGKGGSRGRSSGTRGGQGKGGSGKGKGTGGSRGRSNNTRGGQSKANRNQNKKARRTVKSVSKAVSRAAKGIGKSLKGAAANAATAAGFKKKKQTKLQKQFANFRKRWKQMSTPEAKKKRRADRLKKQFGLDYSRMNDSFRADVNVSQAYKHLGLDKFAPTRAVYNRLPKAVRNFSWSHQFKSPTKLGAADGYRRPNRGGTIDTEQIPSEFGKEIRGVPRGDTGPQQDWLSSLYTSHNINQGKLDQGARDYWSNEAKTKGRDAVMRSIIGTSKAQGTYGGRKKPQRINTGSKRKGKGRIARSILRHPRGRPAAKGKRVGPGKGLGGLGAIMAAHGIR